MIATRVAGASQGIAPVAVIDTPLAGSAAGCSAQPLGLMTEPTCTSTSADSAAESAFSGSGEDICEEPSRLMPMASNDEDIVFAVYMPPQAPTDGQAFFSMPTKSSSDILPAVNAPTASKADTMVRSCPFQRPGLMVPA